MITRSYLAMPGGQPLRPSKASGRVPAGLKFMLKVTTRMRRLAGAELHGLVRQSSGRGLTC